jgi:hypothetical protein
MIKDVDVDVDSILRGMIWQGLLNSLSSIIRDGPKSL